MAPYSTEVRFSSVLGSVRGDSIRFESVQGSSRGTVHGLFWSGMGFAYALY